jgi:hypothetical protein
LAPIRNVPRPVLPKPVADVLCAVVHARRRRPHLFEFVPAQHMGQTGPAALLRLAFGASPTDLPHHPRHDGAKVPGGV